MKPSLVAPPLYVDTSIEALDFTVRALGGAKEIGPKLWPAKKPDRAEKDLLDCLNPNNARELSFDEIMLVGEWGREIGCHLVAAYVNFRLGYAPPIPVDPEDVQAELKRQFHQDVERLARIAARIRP
jgi:hypothetical protein